MTILVLTGGGLSPSLNPTIAGVLHAAREKGWRVLGGLHGWHSVMPGGKIVDLSGIDPTLLRNRGGTILRSSRVNPLEESTALHDLYEILRTHSIDGVIAIGGDDTMTVAHAFATQGAPVVGVPKTIDNDLSGTYWTPGYPTAATACARFVRTLKEEVAPTLSRVVIMETFGFRAGWIAAAAAFGGADLILIPECAVPLDHFLATLEARYHANGRFAVVVMAQEARFNPPISTLRDDQQDMFGKPRVFFASLALRALIKEKLGIDGRVVYPGNLFEGGPPIAIDRETSIALGCHAVHLAEQRAWGRMAALARPRMDSLEVVASDVPIAEGVGETNHRTMSARDFDARDFLPSSHFFDYTAPIFPEGNTASDYETLIRALPNRALQ